MLTVVYFMVGRHFGLVPFFFPGALALLLWLVRWREIRPWQVLVFGAAFASEAVIVGWMPYTWSGGGGPPGNRYFMGVYPALFFLMPPLQSLVVPDPRVGGRRALHGAAGVEPVFHQGLPVPQPRPRGVARCCRSN